MAIQNSVLKFGFEWPEVRQQVSHGHSLCPRPCCRVRKPEASVTLPSGGRENRLAPLLGFYASLTYPSSRFRGFLGLTEGVINRSPRFSILLLMQSANLPHDIDILLKLMPEPLISVRS